MTRFGFGGGETPVVVGCSEDDFLLARLAVERFLAPPLFFAVVFFAVVFFAVVLAVVFFAAGFFAAGFLAAAFFGAAFFVVFFAAAFFGAAFLAAGLAAAFVAVFFGAALVVFFVAAFFGAAFLGAALAAFAVVVRFVEFLFNSGFPPDLDQDLAKSSWMSLRPNLRNKTIQNLKRTHICHQSSNDLYRVSKSGCQ